MNPTFQGEVQFRRWSDSSTQGVQVTFALPDSEALEPLKGMEGKRFMAVLVQIGDDEQPVEAVASKWSALGPKCKEAIDMANNAEFQKFVNCKGADAAGETIKEMCLINSREDLDKDGAAYYRFVENVRKPFQRWVREGQK